MIRAGFLVVAKSLLEIGIVFLAVGAVLCVLSFRVGRRLITTSDDPLERISARAAQLNQLIPRRRRATAAGDEEYGEEDA